MSSDWQKTDDVFNRVLEYEGDDPDAFLKVCCDGDAELEAEVRRYLNVVEQAPDFLTAMPEFPVVSDINGLRELVGRRINPDRAEYEPVPAGSRLGAYQIVECIGAGGMGSVYRAERSDGEFEQRVAIKVMHCDLAKRSLVERFLRERQILADLEHANIARLIGGGTTSDDSPYLVMEYVEGEDLITYASVRQLSLKNRLRLFIQVCRAVQYAHECGVIHRDLKPGNILVTQAGSVKLLDFGVARLLNPESNLEMTGIGPAPLTPAHASPEQIRGAAATAHSDQYQLGLVLYQLIAGRLPVGESPRPPTQVKGASRASDIDYVCLKALSAEPEDRYASVRAMEEDVEACLSGQIVLARKDSIGYRVKRLLIRHRLAVVGGFALGIIALALVFFTGVPGPGNQADIDAMVTTSIAILPFETRGMDDSGTLAAGIHGDLLRRLADTTDLKVIAGQSVRKYQHTELTPAQISRELGVRWILVGNTQQQDRQIGINVQLIDPRNGVQVWADSYQRHLDTSNLFEVQDEIAHAIAGKLESRISPTKQRPSNLTHMPDMEAYRLYVQGRTLLDMREQAEMLQSLALFRRAVEQDPDYALAWVGLADAITLLIDYGVNLPTGMIAEAEQAAQQAIELQPELGEAYAALGSVEYLKLNGTEALVFARRSIELSPKNADLLGRVSWAALMFGEPEDALHAAEKAVAINPLALEPFSNLVLSLLAAGEAQQALEHITNSQLPRANWDSIQFYEGIVRYHLGQYAQAISALDRLEITWAGEGPLAAVALAYAGQGEFGKARDLLAQLKSRNSHPYLIGLVYVALGEDGQAWAFFESAHQWDEDSDWPTLSARYLYRDLLGDRVNDPRFIALVNRINQGYGLATEPAVDR